MIKSDVIVIGGGLAGLNSAYRLLENEKLKVVLVEKQRSSRNNPARFTFDDVVNKYNLDDCVLAAYNGFGMLTYNGAKTLHRYENKIFVALDYNKSCIKIFNKIKIKKNFNYYNGRVTDIYRSDKYINVKLLTGEIFQSQLLIDASGKTHLAHNILGEQSPKLYSHSFGQTFVNCNNENISDAYFIGSSVDYGSGGGWFYPLGKKKASVGFALITESSRFPKEILTKKYNKGIREVHPVCDYLSKAKAIQYEVGTIPIQPVSKFYFDRILVVGDAAGQATSWTCMGIEPALENSDFAAYIARKAFDKNDFSSNLLSEYQDLWERENKKTFNHIEKQKTKIWFLGEEVWDFIVEKDLNLLSSSEFLERIRYNKHLMPTFRALFRWILFRIKHYKDWKKYKQHALQNGDI